METNTRPLRAANGKFHLGSVALANGLSLCNFCDRQAVDCSDPENVETCGDVVPGLYFVGPHIGLDGAFSTFRASAIWYDRARVLMKTHQTIALIESGTGARLGRARLVDAVRGPFWALMQEHAHTNHLFSGLDLGKSEAQARLEKWIRLNMGSRFVKERDAVGTVLYLERLP